MEPNAEPIQTPFCGELRSKRFLMLDTIPTRAEQYLDPSLHCWCYHTQQTIGPDGGFVEPEECVPGRSCYRSALAPEPLPPTPPVSEIT
ncbi:MAG: hypothetical protein QM702_03405 [Rubrivivax sp.]